MSSDEDGRTRASFLRGMTLGAILGAILAGSSLWSRRRRRGPGHSHGPGPGDGPSPGYSHGSGPGDGPSPGPGRRPD